MLSVLIKTLTDFQFSIANQIEIRVRGGERKEKGGGRKERGSHCEAESQTEAEAGVSKDCR